MNMATEALPVTGVIVLGSASVDAATFGRCLARRGAGVRGAGAGAG